MSRMIQALRQIEARSRYRRHADGGFEGQLDRSAVRDATNESEERAAGMTEIVEESPECDIPLRHADLSIEEVASLLESADELPSDESTGDTEFLLAPPREYVDDESDEQFIDASTPSEIPAIDASQLMLSGEDVAAETVPPETTAQEPDAQAREKLNLSLDCASGSRGPRNDPAQACVVNEITRDASSEDYERLAKNLVAKFPAGIPVSIALVTVGQEVDVAQFVCRAAAALAEHGSGKVLLVNANVTENGISTQVEPATAPGVFDVLDRHKLPGEFIPSTADSQLAVPPADRGPADDLSDANQWATTLHDLKQRYRFVLLDAGSTDCPRTLTVCRQADAVFMVIQLGQTDSAMALETVETLRHAGARLLGTIVAARHTAQTL